MQNIIKTPNNPSLKYFLWIILFCLFFAEGTFSQSLRDFELKNIKFNGNDTFSGNDLKLIIASQETPWWFWKFLNSFTNFGEEPVYFDTSKVRIDKSAIVSFYNAHGFFLTDVTNEIEVDSANKYITLLYIIDEGKSARFGSFNLKGFDNMPEWLYNNMISELNGIDSTKRYSQVEVQKSIDNIIIYLADHGYLFGDYDSTIIMMDTLLQRANIDVHFTLEDLYTISEIRIDKDGIGASEISNDLIKEIADVRKDQLYSQQQIDRGQFRLFRTGLFTSLDIDPVLPEALSGRVPLLIKARIGTLNEISPEIKADNQNNSFNTGLGINYIRKNFLGDARKLTLSLSTRIIDLPNFNISNIFHKAADTDDSFQGDVEAVIRVEQPFLFGRPILSTSETYYRGLTIINQTGIEYGASQKFDFEMPNYTFLTLLRPSLNIDFTDYTFDQPDQDLSVNISSTTPGLGVELASTKTDDLFFPAKGYSLYLNPEIAQSKTRMKLTGVESGDSSGTTYFYRVQASMAYYLGLKEDRSSVFAVKLRSGYIQTLSGEYALIPPTKTFFAGGSNSLRGWRARELVPKDQVEYFGITAQNQIRGGTFLLEGAFELRQKLSESFGLALFTDYGNTWNGYKNILISDIAVAAGFGFRVYTPIAPFRLDFGVKFYNPEDRKNIFGKKFFNNLEIHFGIGEAF